MNAKVSKSPTLESGVYFIRSKVNKDNNLSICQKILNNDAFLANENFTKKSNQYFLIRKMIFKINILKGNSVIVSILFFPIFFPIFFFFTLHFFSMKILNLNGNLVKHFILYKNFISFHFYS